MAAASAEAMFEAAVEAGADEVESGAEEHVVICAPEALNAVRDALEGRFGAPASARLVWRPQSLTPVDGETAEALFKLLETLEDSDDVQNVFANFEVSDEVMARALRLKILRCACSDSIRVCVTPAGASSMPPATACPMSPRASRIRARAGRSPSGLSDLFRALNAVLDAYRPDAAAVEESFVNKNPASTLKLGVARGVVLLAPAERGIPVPEYSANLIKKSVVGVGHADKPQIQMMVRRLLPGCALDSADAADALAVAICHAHHAATLRAWSHRQSVPCGEGAR